MKRRHLPHPDELWALKNGTDRGDKQRMWVEVAEITGYSSSHMKSVAYAHARRPPSAVVIDPRDYDTDLAEILSDEDVRKWQECPRCLCGCGEAVKQETKHGGVKVPQGAYRLFYGSHGSRMPSRRNSSMRSFLSPESKAAKLVTRRKDHYPTDDLAEMIWSWRNAEQGRSLRILAEHCKITRSHVMDISSQRKTHVTKLTAARVMAVLREPMTRPMAEQYRRWLRRSGLADELPQPRISK